jgi:hypothetical protein
MDRIQQVLSLDDLWSLLGYVLVLFISQVTRPPLPLASGSLLASGMLVIIWLGSQGLRARNKDRYPNARVVFWSLIAAASAIATAL